MADNKESRTVGAGLLITALMALVLLFMGTALITFGFCLMAHPKDTTDVFWTEVKHNEVLRSDELRVIDPFLTSDGAAGKTSWCLVSFRDASGDMCVGAMTVEPDDAIAGVLEEYVNDPEAALGAFVVKGYFSLSESDGLGATFTTAYTDACGKYDGVLKELSSRYYDGNVRLTSLHFSYICGENENYLAAQGRQDTVSGVIGIVLACAGTAGIVLTVIGLVSARKRNGETQTGPSPEGTV